MSFHTRFLDFFRVLNGVCEYAFPVFCLERPEFQTFTVTPESVQAGKTITINVVTTGNPVPKLICYLMSTSGIEIDRFPRSGENFY